MLSDIIKNIYATIDNRSLWKNSLANIAKYCNGNDEGGAALVPLDPDCVQWRYGSSKNEESDLLYYSQWKGKSPLISHKPQSMPGDFFYIDDSFLTDEEINRSPFYQEYLKKFGVRRLQNCLFENFQGKKFLLSVQNPINASTETVLGSKKKLLTLVPHIIQAINIGDNFYYNKNTKDCFQCLIDSMPYAIAIFDKQNNVLFANDKMVEMEQHGIFIINNRIKNQYEDSKIKIEKLLKTSEKDTYITFTTKSQKHFIAKIGFFNNINKNDQDVSLIFPKFLIIHDCQINKNTEKILKNFFLSPAQSKISCMIANGLPVKDIAKSLNITEGTTRQTIKEAFTRLDINSQVKLASFIKDIDCLP
ncbi:LuxR family transcriptional regulator [Acetobacter pasteurianus]|uniref:Uncharacterized protein n=1 Tax=Acetobacter pasteurianus TaxID=438 RepID=A0A1A0DAG2_ACEPA|nr:helix-turn-helix transcriptional regulator [Acetobacter pasteurianus]OAZ72129.1 hypothetical protein SRCM100623_01879 [Acetobacter pasteurianus]RCL06597.1 LuxR family transcriptional regulator [Acetobacter pasteurianus]GAB32177.1 two component response regulator LuxR [Acetobacter pasteurianus subsp. pasteurianus LMG 1262 = NBRC 106471]GCD48864.1 LuxR family transcriptional regulator [Acetobacter pasteurianus subsp. pasteurianus LMG 1262 = NBRC 106471]